MDLIGLVKLILALALVGFLVYLIVTYIPMPEIFKQVIMVVIAIVVILFVLSFLLGSGDMASLRLH